MKRFRPGTIYCLRIRRRGLLWWLPARAYIGQTRYRDYRKRIHQHLYGHWRDGQWNPPKYWAHEVIDYYPLWQSRRWSDWGIDTREFLCIRALFPIHNVLLNLGNPRRIIPPPVDQRVYPTPDQITAVERWPNGRPGVAPLHVLAAVLSLVTSLVGLVLFLPGLLERGAVLWDQGISARRVGVWLFAVVGAGWVVSRGAGRRTRRRRR